MGNTRRCVDPPQEARELELSGGVWSLPRVRGGTPVGVLPGGAAPHRTVRWLVNMRLPAFRFLFFFARPCREGKEEQEKIAPARPEMLFDRVDRASLRRNCAGGAE